MEVELKILIVEDEMLLAAELAMNLEALGYKVLDMLSSGKEVLDFLKTNDPPDLILMDIQLDGEMDGIETVKAIQKQHTIPIIYLTANADDLHFKMAKETKPEAFLSKPFKKLELQRAIELAAEKMNLRVANQPTEKGHVIPFLLHDFIYVKNRDKLVKVIIHDIQYIEAERNYSRIYTSDKEYLLVMTLKDIEEKLPSPHFMRIHRSFIINITRIDEASSDLIIINNKTIPISKSQRSELLQKLPTL